MTKEPLQVSINHRVLLGFVPYTNLWFVRFVPFIVVRYCLRELDIHGLSCHSFQVIAYIEDQPVIDKILSHLEKKGELPSTPDTLPETRAPPQTSLFS